MSRSSGLLLSERKQEEHSTRSRSIDEHSIHNDGRQHYPITSDQREIPDSEDDAASALDENDEQNREYESHGKGMGHEARMDTTDKGHRTNSKTIGLGIKAYTILADDITPKTVMAEGISPSKHSHPILRPSTSHQEPGILPEQLQQTRHSNPMPNASAIPSEPAKATTDTKSSTSSSASATGTLSPKAQRLQSQNTALQTQIADTSTELEAARMRFSERKTRVGQEPEEPEAVVKRHIKLLQRYNEMKDLGLGLAGLVAEGR